MNTIEFSIYTFTNDEDVYLKTDGGCNGRNVVSTGTTLAKYINLDFTSSKARKPVRRKGLLRSKNMNEKKNENII